MTVHKYNQTKGTFEKIELPDDWKCVTFQDLLNTVINCANCGKPILYGKSFVSKEILKGGINGSGCSVCGECSAKEVRTEKEMLRG